MHSTNLPELFRPRHLVTDVLTSFVATAKNPLRSHVMIFSRHWAALANKALAPPPPRRALTRGLSIRWPCWPNRRTAGFTGQPSGPFAVSTVEQRFPCWLPLWTILTKTFA